MHEASEKDISEENLIAFLNNLCVSHKGIVIKKELVPALLSAIDSIKKKFNEELENDTYDRGYRDGAERESIEEYDRGYERGHSEGYEEGYKTALREHQ